MTSTGNSDPRLAIRALAADVICVLVFCALGRSSHAEGLHLSGIAETAWPFLAGTGIGWAIARAWRNPTDPLSSGLIIWICTVTVGMLLRVTIDQGVAPSFVVVAALVTGVLLLGWRVLVRVVTARR